MLCIIDRFSFFKSTNGNGILVYSVSFVRTLFSVNIGAF